MVKTKGARSKRISSARRHKIDRKKREHVRDVRNAAKELKKSGLGPKRSKRSREAAKLALRVSNADPDKERMLEQVLHARETGRVLRHDRRTQAKEDRLTSASACDADESTSDTDVVDREAPHQQQRSLLYLPIAHHYDALYQFRKVINELVFPTDKEEGIHELPASTFLVTCDARCSIQSLPWTLLDAIVERNVERAAALTGAPRASLRTILIVITLTKIDLVSAKALGTQVALIDQALAARYKNENAEASLAGIRFTIAPFSSSFDVTTRHLLKILRYFSTETNKNVDKDVASSKTNMYNKVSCIVLGLPNSGRRTLCRCMQSLGSESAVTIVPLRTARLQLSAESKEDSETMLFFPQSKQITVVTIAEDAALRQLSSKNVIAGDVIFQSPSFIEKMPDPEACAVLIVNKVRDKIALSQAFCQPAIEDSSEAASTRGAERFLRGIGHTVRRDKGFNVSPLLLDDACTAGQIGASNLLAQSGFTSQKTSLLDSTYSNARPSKFVRIAAVVNRTHKRDGAARSIKKSDSHNALRIGARSFIREFCSSRNVPWAILRPRDEEVAKIGVNDGQYLAVLSYSAFAADSKAVPREGDIPFASLAESLSALLRNCLMLMPSAVVEVNADCIAPILHDVANEFSTNEEEQDEVTDEEGEEIEAETGDDDDDDAEEQEDAEEDESNESEEEDNEV